jgi:hypothetical protein
MKKEKDKIADQIRAITNDREDFGERAVHTE